MFDTAEDLWNNLFKLWLYKKKFNLTGILLIFNTEGNKSFDK